ncbi:THUMP-like domain-containing protein [Spirosoma fluviale]|uniref:Protein-L-isoaspartate(D-aspartate) O-methyltransferase (PCMT) n=1 Tax=Spirosoma fluviale TaxID=1597977 RepID=A0A286FGC6_9BACT|nr:SAM-dependent methyltransferase [Spirosoma fluviale]SOD82275.1 Protein-L-isoaspartate(D-aspartate) O-methyltransferase (PCMT) [Spirosoma fluviale]
MTKLSLPEQAYIQTHLTDNVSTLLLKGAPDGLDIRKLAAQIAARQKAKEKLPTWYTNNALVFPPGLSVEQASSEETALYKASLVSGHRLLDLTGGMGVDTWAFSQRVERVLYVERNPELAGLAAHNLPLLGATNVTVHTGDGLSVVRTTVDVPADWLYLDPHRRDETGGKVVQLQDCEPDITQPETLGVLQAGANRILLKASPLLDIDLAIRQLAKTVESVHIIAVQGEVKETLFVLGNQAIEADRIKVNAVNLLAEQSVTFSFNWEDERSAEVPFGDPQTYLYEPNAAVMKAGAFRLVGARFGLTKLAPNSHIYTSTELRKDFPGRIFKFNQLIRPDTKTLKVAIPDLKANLTVRNFPQSVAELRKKLSLREGGDTYIFATTLLNGNKRLLITKKVA